MKRLTKTLLYGYGAFAVVNVGLAWLSSTARTGRKPGDSQLLDFNDKLLPYNVLARVLQTQPAYLTSPMVVLPDTIVQPGGTISS